MAKAKRAVILGLVEKAWGSVGQEASSEETISRDSQAQTSRSPGGSGKAPGYGARKGQRKGPLAPPPRRKP